MNPLIIGAAVIGGILYLVREDDGREAIDTTEKEKNEQKVKLLETQEEIRKLRGQLRKAERVKKSLIKSATDKE